MNRINSLLKYVDENKVVADIGSDHGITAIEIYEKKSPKKVIATDISKNSLQKLVDKLKYLKYDIQTMVTDGIYELPKDVEQIIISGMGGYLIVSILEKGIDIAKSAEKLILQGNNSQSYLRHWLHDNFFEIIDEDIVEDGDFIYNIIVARFSEKKEKYQDEVYYSYGKKNIEEKNQLTKKVMDFELKNLRNILDKIKDTHNEKTRQKINELQEEIKRLEEWSCKLEK